jgi:hypothetical protein
MKKNEGPELYRFTSHWSQPFYYVNVCYAAKSSTLDNVSYLDYTVFSLN